MTRVSLPALLLFFATGCPGESTDTGDKSGVLETALVGIYSIDTWTENSASCEGAGDDVLGGSTPSLLVNSGDLYGVSFLTADDYETAEDARAAATDSTTSLSGWMFYEGSDDEGWLGGQSAGYGDTEDESGCWATAMSDRLSKLDGGVSIERLAFDLGDVGVDADGWCALPDDAVSAATDKPCVASEAVTATFSESL